MMSSISVSSRSPRSRGSGCGGFGVDDELSRCNCFHPNQKVIHLSNNPLPLYGLVVRCWVLKDVQKRFNDVEDIYAKQGNQTGTMRLNLSSLTGV